MTIYGWGLLVYLIILLGVGFYASSKVKNMDDYLVAGRSGTFIPLLGTFVATFTSASIWIGGAASFYKSGWSQIWQGPGTAIAPVVMLFFVGPYLRRFAKYTLSDFFEARYHSRNLRFISALLILFLYYTILVAQTMGGARIIQMALGWDYILSLIVVCSVFIIYTTIGGQLTVMWTDTFQFFVMIIGSFGTLYYCLKAMGGLNGLNTKLLEIDPILLTGDGGGAMPISLALAFILIWGFGNSSQPYTITRFYIAKDAKTAVLSSGVGALAVAFFWILVGIVGLTARVLYPNIAHIDLAYPSIAINLLPVPLGILMTCGLIAAIITSADTLIVTAGAVFGRDIYQSFINQNASDKQVVKISRIGTMTLGILALITAINPPGPVITITIFAWSVLASAFFVPLVTGIHFKFPNKEGAYASMIGGAICCLGWFGLGKPLGLHPVLIGFSTSLILLVVVSKVTKSEGISEDLWYTLHPKKRLDTPIQTIKS